jgi:hypothetical protein
VTATGYSALATVPWKALNAEPIPLHKIGIDFRVTDYDNEAYATVYGWYRKGEQDINPSIFGAGILEDANAVSTAKDKKPTPGALSPKMFTSIKDLPAEYEVFSLDGKKLTGFMRNAGYETRSGRICIVKSTKDNSARKMIIR